MVLIELIKPSQIRLPSCKEGAGRRLAPHRPTQSGDGPNPLCHPLGSGIIWKSCLHLLQVASCCCNCCPTKCTRSHWKTISTYILLKSQCCKCQQVGPMTMPMSAGHWAVDIGYCILDAAYFYFYLARRVLLCCAKSIGNNFSLFFHLPQVGFKVFQAARARGQPTRIKIIFKVRTFEVGPLLISQMQRLLVYRFRFAFLDAEMLRCWEMRLHATGGRCLAAFWMLWVMTANNRISSSS